MVKKNKDYLINKDTLRDLAYKKIKEFILKGVIKPGEKIMQEKMAADLGISKIPLIQALALLEKEGLMIKLPRKGFFIRDISKDEIVEILEIRSIFEQIGVKKLVEKLDKEKIAKLRKYLKVFHNYYNKNNKDDYILEDADFHFFLIKASENKMIINFVEIYNIFILTFLKGILDLKESYHDHKKIIQLILNQESVEAALSIKQHLNKVKNKII